MLKDQIIRATKETGGFTSPLVQKEGRYIVAINGLGKSYDLDKITIEEAIDDYMATIPNPHTFRIGTWVDTETNKLWCDLSRGYASKGVALDVAKATGELAIFDLETTAEIRV